MKDLKRYADLYIEEYKRVVGDLLDGRDARTIKGTERKAISGLAHEEAGKKFPAIARCTAARKEQVSRAVSGKEKHAPLPGGASEMQRIGHSIFSRAGQVWPKKKRTSAKRAKEQETPRADGVAESYLKAATMYDLLPPDDMVAQFVGCSASMVALAREAAQDNGFTLEEAAIDSDDSALRWRVTGRPGDALSYLEGLLSGVSKDDLVELLAEALSRKREAK